MPEDAAPIQPVEHPFLCSPYKEPDQHWLYHRRPAFQRKQDPF
jgi:hypothetical protein